MPPRRTGSLSGELFERAPSGRGKVAVRGRRALRRSPRPGVEPGDGATSLLEPEPPPVVEAVPDVAFGEPRRDFEYLGGVHLTDSILWFDCQRRHDLTFLSHAHVDYAGKNRKILATEKTVRILTRASGKIDALTSPYQRAFMLGPLRLEMHPAGHVLGSAQLLIERDGRRLVYTSDVNPRPSATVERARAVPCDVLVIPATYGVPLYRFPPKDEIVAELSAYVDRCFEDAATPVLIAEQIGTSQELIRLLGERGYKMRVHGSIYDISKKYKDLGVSMPGARRFQGTPARDELVIFPPILRKHLAIRKLKKSRTVLISGRAVEPGFAVQQRVDAAFALADAADHQDLLQFVVDSGARDVYLTGGFVEEFAAELRGRGLRAYSLVPPKQLQLL